MNKSKKRFPYAKKTKQHDSDYTKKLKKLNPTEIKDGLSGDFLLISTSEYRNYVNAASLLKRKTNKEFNYMTKKMGESYFLWRVK